MEVLKNNPKMQMEQYQEFDDLLTCVPILVKRPENVFAALTKQYDENTISNALSFLFDASRNGGHAELLQEFLKITGVGYTDEMLSETPTITREYTFDGDYGRIDFIIEYKDCVIGIENKIWSSLGPKQIERYTKAMKTESGFAKKKIELCLLYPGKNTSVSDYISKSGCHDCKCITYEKTMDLFKKANIAHIDNDYLFQFILKEFIRNIEDYIVNKKMDDIELDNLTFCGINDERIIKLQAVQKRASESFCNYIIQKISSEYATEDGWEQPIINKTCKWVQLYRKGWDVSMYHFEIVPEKYNFSTVPSKMKVVLHTHEGEMRNHKETGLYALQEEVSAYIKEKHGGTDCFGIDYTNDEAFEKSMDLIMSVFNEMVKEFTLKVEKEKDKLCG